MVAMASDSYLLKMPPTPCQAGCRGAAAPRSTSCGMVAALVLMLAAVLALAGMLYYQRLELYAVRVDVAAMDRRLLDVDTKLNRLHEYESIKAFERASQPLQDEDVDEEDDLSEEDDGDDPDPYYSDIEEDGLMFERRGAQAAWPGRHASVIGEVAGPPSAAATALTKLEEADADSDSASPEWSAEEPSAATPTSASVQPTRARREAPAPQLRLYHMLQGPGPAAVGAAPGGPPEQGWRPQPMYAERAPEEFVDPPPGRNLNMNRRRHRPTHREPVEVARRRSRVMATQDAAVEAAPKMRLDEQRRRHYRWQQHPQQAMLGQPEAPAAPAARGRPGQSRGERSIDAAAAEAEQTWRPSGPAVVEGPAVAAHFVGDTTRQRSDSGGRYAAQHGRLMHPTGEYPDWKPSPWVRALGLDRHFRVGDAAAVEHVVVDTPGLYLVYAQVNYSDEIKEENGFWVYRNGNRELLCASRGPGTHTCFTAGVLQLGRGDRVTLKDLAGDRYRLLDHPGRSFLGLVHLSACKLKAEQPGRVAA